MAGRSSGSLLFETRGSSCARRRCSFAVCGSLSIRAKRSLCALVLCPCTSASAISRRSLRCSHSTGSSSLAIVMNSLASGLSAHAGHARRHATPVSILITYPAPRDFLRRGRPDRNDVEDEAQRHAGERMIAVEHHLAAGHVGNGIAPLVLLHLHADRDTLSVALDRLQAHQARIVLAEGLLRLELQA